MIKKFDCKHTAKIWNGNKTTKWDAKVIKIALRKLFMLNAAHHIKDLRVPPSNKLHSLKREYKGYHSIKINDQWRIIFIWEGNDCHSVKIIDYH